MTEEKQQGEKSEKPLTRQQRRIKDRIEHEATVQLTRLQNKFTDFIINCDNPETEAPEKAKIMSGQWKLYCNSKKFSDKARVLFEEWANKVIDQYKVESGSKEGFGIIETPKTND